MEWSRLRSIGCPSVRSKRVFNGLVIHKIYNGYWFFGRPTAEELRQDLRAVGRKCRLDWDISKPELKAAWERATRSCFTPMANPISTLSGKPIKPIAVKRFPQMHAKRWRRAFPAPKNDGRFETQPLFEVKYFAFLT
jgi:hypothetical protein